MTSHDGPQTATDAPWWASGRTPDDGIDDQDPLAAHRQARGPGGDPSEPTSEPGSDGFTDPAAPHPDGQVCQACPVCLVLRAVRASRPEVIGHLAEAAHHLALALQAFAETHAGADPDLTKIDLDP